MSPNTKVRNVLRLAIPNKGRIADPIIELVEAGGLKLENSRTRKLITKTSDSEIEVLFARPIDIPEYVANGAADIGITGRDMVLERGSDVEEILDLKSGNARLVLAVPEDSGIKSASDLNGLRVATEFPGICEKYFNEQNISVSLVPVGGACEAAPYLGIADAVVDLTSSGTTLATNNLIIIDEILNSTTILIGNKNSKVKFSEKIEEFCTAIDSVIRARGQRYLMMNVERKCLDRVRDVLPGLSGPTVMDVVSSDNMVAVHAVVSEDHLYSLVSTLKRAGAKDILVVPIERMIR
ncbi:ATP phosphoribosyltransferase [Methanomicrobium antiquum]|uniref:ATP phosphoribosyltransferase n=1 Tax=Methanomicrobium antiquum TaxID=487686 RepID=A0AAF0JN73_9EURY|nr:ATP phosphoribosyltransferase [Methanomicrobium antiquum]MDD3976670.1 ATP phosphoribosyltransferase [Methanomicrobium sp.]WFN37285.1 ATP phosphoribosyltransferase [Methanomicrobium antiquum]